MSEEDIRLQKVLAAAGLGSRRACEVMISDGRVEVNGRIVIEQGCRVNPETDVIRVDGSRIPPARHHAYLVLNKPRGVVSTMDDPEGRPSLAEFIAHRKHDRLYHVGRLDTDTEGLLLLTNDGELAHRLTHPSYVVQKTYIAEVSGEISQGTLKKLTRGIRLDDGPVRPDRIKLMQRGGGKTLLTVVLHEGRNRIVRRMFDTVGHPVTRLTRIAVGPVRLGRLPVGQLRELTREELGQLIDLVDL